jgi:DNA-binding transcriptional LysR family regulator
MRPINHGRLAYFEAVCATGSVRGAADRLNTSPSVVTRQVGLLERELGVALFERKARGMAPTDAAGHLRDYRRGCEAHRQQLAERLAAIARLDEGHVRIVLSEGYADHLMAHIVGPFCAAHPKLEVAVDGLPVRDIIREVAEDAAHFGLAYNPQADARLNVIASVAAPAQLLLRRDHPLAQRRRPVTVAQIQDFPFGAMPEGYGVSQLVEALEYAEHVRLRPAFTSTSVVALRRYVRTTLGVAIIGAGVAAADDVVGGELVMLPIAHPICAGAKLRLLVRRGRPLSAPAARLLADLRARLASFVGSAAPRRKER